MLPSCPPGAHSSLVTLNSSLSMTMRIPRSLSAFALTLIVFVLGVAPAHAQQKIGYVDSEYILQNVPEYATIQQNVDRLAAEWQAELEKLQREVDEMFTEYQARELLYTNEERQRKQEEIMQAEQEIEQFRLRHFGPEGELFKQQEQLMRPLQERILEAIDEVATSEGYDYILDKSGDLIFLFSREQYDVSLYVLEELGIDTEKLSGGRAR